EYQVAKRLRHLLAVQENHRLVQPMARKQFTSGRLRLCRFAFVVRKYEVGSPAVEIDRFPEFTHGQCRTFNVPTGTTRAPWRFPRRLVRCRWLPQHEIERVALVHVV